jgi:hypothetical protein
MHRTHTLFHRCELTPGLDHRGHVKLVFEISSGYTERLGHSCHYISVLEVPGEGFLTNDTLDFGSTFNGFGYVAHNLEAGVVGGKNTDHVDSGTESCGVLENPGIAQAIFACTFGKGLCALWCTNAG